QVFSISSECLCCGKRTLGGKEEEFVHPSLWTLYLCDKIDTCNFLDYFFVALMHTLARLVLRQRDDNAVGVLPFPLLNAPCPELMKGAINAALKRPLVVRYGDAHFNSAGHECVAKEQLFL